MTDIDTSNVAMKIPAPAPVVGAALAAQAQEGAEQKVEGNLPPLKASLVGQIPDINELQSMNVGRPLTERLDPQKLKMAEEYASKVKLDDVMAITHFGAKQQNDARKATGHALDFIRKDARMIDLGPDSEVGQLMNEYRDKLKELGIGRLEPQWYDRVIAAIPPLAKFAKRIETITAKYDHLSGRVEEILGAMKDKQYQIETLYDRSKEVQKTDKGELENITFAAAVLELVIKKTHKEYKEEYKKYESKKDLDEEDNSRISAMSLNLEGMDQRLLTLKTMRVQTRDAMRKMDLLMEKMVQGASTLENRIMLSESIWKSQINNALAEYQLRGLAALLETSEEMNNGLIKINNTNLPETVQRITRAAGRPGVDLGLLKTSVELTDQLYKKTREDAVENRKLLKEGIRLADEIDESMNAKSNDLEFLKRHLAVYGDE